MEAAEGHWERGDRTTIDRIAAKIRSPRGELWYVIGPAGARRIVAIYVPGNIISLPGFMLRREDQTVVGLSTCEIAFLPSETATRLSANFPGIRNLFCVNRLGGHDFAEMDGATEAFGSYRTPLLRTVHARHHIVGLVSPGQSLDLPITQYQLAEALGASLVHTNKSVRILKSNGFLEIRSRSHQILDFEGLAEHAGFSGDYLLPAAAARSSLRALIAARAGG